MKKLFVLIIAIIVLAGCQRTQWVRANTTAQQFNADKYQCEIEALRMYPSTAGQPIGNPSYSTNCTGYGNTLNCTSQQNQQMRSWYDTNAYPRARMEEQCLMARGYSKQAINSQKPSQYKAPLNKDDMYMCELSSLKYHPDIMTKSRCKEIGGTPQKLYP